jgi:hypothetical protein
MPALEDPKYEVFCREYVKHSNGARAVVAAGWDCKTWQTAGSTSASAKAAYLLKKDSIRFRIQQLTEQRARKADVSVEYVLTKLKTVIQRSLQEVKAKIDPVTKRPTGEFEYDSKGVVSASKLIGEYLGMWSEKLLPATGDTYHNTQVNIYVAENRRQERLADGQPSHGSARAGSENGQDSSRPRLCLPDHSHGQH